jgi:hypothetical protein
MTKNKKGKLTMMIVLDFGIRRSSRKTRKEKSKPKGKNVMQAGKILLLSFADNDRKLNLSEPNVSKEVDKIEK